MRYIVKRTSERRAGRKRCLFILSWFIRSRCNTYLLLISISCEIICHYESRTRQKIKSPNGEPEIGCQSAVFCKTSLANLAYFQENFIQLQKGKRGKVGFAGIPEKSRQGAIGLALDQKDRITDIAYSGTLKIL